MRQFSKVLAKLTSRLSISCLLVAVLGSVVVAEEDMRLRLKDGSFAKGDLVGTESNELFGWQMPALNGIVELDLNALRSVTRLGATDDDQPVLDGVNIFELTNGEVVVGSWEGMTKNEVLVDSTMLGPIAIERQRLLAVSDAAYQGDLVYRGPRDDGSWRSLAEDLAWDFEAGALTTSKQGATAIGNVKLPKKAQVNLVLTWKGVPDFVISFGTSNKAGTGPVDAIQAAARLEVWDRQLAIVREVEGGADIALVTDLTEANPRIELTLYIDQVEGVVTVCDSHGRPLDTVTAKSDSKEELPCVHLVHHGAGMTLERLEIRKWDGLATSMVGGGSAYVIKADGSRVDAELSSFDAEKEMVEIVFSDGKTEDIPLEDIRRATMAPGDAEETVAEKDDAGALPPTVQQPEPLEDGLPVGEFDDLFGDVKPNDSEEDASSEESEPSETQEEAAIEAGLEVEVVLADRSRILGKWLKSKNGLLCLQANGIKTVSPESRLDFVAFSPANVRGLIGSDDRYELPEISQRRGTLKLDNAQLAGFLAPESPAGSRTALHWQPLASPVAYELTEQAAGAIVYRKQLPKVKVAQPQNARANRQLPMLNIFLGGKAKAAPKKNATASSTGGRELLFRSGDGINGTVERIDAKGVYFSSEQTSTPFATHDQMQSVVLNKQEKFLTTSPDKMKRLMTVPRSMKTDPPTHLFIAVNGDYLRGRLVRMEAGLMTIEVRLDLMEIPTEQVSQIVWLHDREWDEEKAGDGDDAAQGPEIQSNTAFSVHGISANDRGLTFQPVRTVGGVVSGKSDLLGDCSINVDDVNQILFGKDIGVRVREFHEDPWTLSLAQYPRVFDQSDEPNDPMAGTDSGLVGAPAPNIFLDTLAGEKFNLKKSLDRVVVLDFWASWCGPCVQTMPLVEAAMEEIGDDKVQLIAVNIQESPERVQRAVESLKINATVALDVDGEIAAAYQANAIPQTVVINQDGEVTHVFVGGGARTVEQLKNAVLGVLGEPL